MTPREPSGFGEPQRRYRQATPDDVEQRLYQLGNELDGAFNAIQQAETDYLDAKTAYDLAFARAYMTASGSNMRAREAEAMSRCEVERKALTAAETLVKAARENSRRIYAHVDIARSVSVIVRAAIGASQ